MAKCCCDRRCRCDDRGLVTLDTGQPIVLAPPAEQPNQPERPRT